MGYLIRILTFVLGWTVFRSDGTVTLSFFNSADGGNQLECNSEVILVCDIDPFSNLISWKINYTLYVICSPTCLENTPFPGNYSFTYDFANGIFNLTINQVTFGDSNTNFQCDDGSDVASNTTEVIPAYSGNVTDVNSTDEEYQLVFTTACVYPDVEFNWFTVKVGNSDGAAYIMNQTESNETTSCALDNKCGGTGTAKVSSSVSVKKVSKGEERFIGVVVTYKHPDENRTFLFDESFIFEVQGCWLDCVCIIIIIYGVRWIQLIQSYFIGFSQCEMYKVTKVEDVSNWYILLFFFECIPVVGILVAVVSVCWKFQEVKPNSWGVPVNVASGCFPLLGTFYTAYLILCLQRKELCVAERCILFCVGWIFDVGILVVMVLACCEVIEIPCCLFGLFAVLCLMTAWVNFVCLAEFLYLQQRDLCSRCHQVRKVTIAEKKCTDCNEYLCNECLNEHLEWHTELRDDISHNQIGYYIHQQSNEFCCQLCQKHVEGYCSSCDWYLCKKCMMLPLHAEHTLLRNHENADNESVPAVNYIVKPKEFLEVKKCERCENDGEHKHRPIECYCFVYDENMCAHCFVSIREQSYARPENNEACALHSVRGKRASADVKCFACNVYLCTRCFILHLQLEDLWKQQQFDMNFINKNELKKIRTDDIVGTDLPLIYIFVGCFPVLGIFWTIKTWCTCRMGSAVCTMDSVKISDDNKTVVKTINLFQTDVHKTPDA